MNSNVVVLLRFFILSGLIGALFGCASPISKDAVVAHDITGLQQYKKNVSINTQGGSDSGGDISNSEFAKAIEESITANGLFFEVIHKSGADYMLSVRIIKMVKPVFGGTFTVDMEAAWTLMDPVTKRVVMRQSIKSTGVSTMGEAFAGVTRLRLAVESAVRKNITKGLIAISNSSGI